MSQQQPSWSRFQGLVLTIPLVAAVCQLCTRTEQEAPTPIASEPREQREQPPAGLAPRAIVEAEDYEPNWESVLSPDVRALFEAELGPSPQKELNARDKTRWHFQQELPFNQSARKRDAQRYREIEDLIYRLRDKRAAERQQKENPCPPPEAPPSPETRP